jgi:starch-binding outer membrane protein, SusD/RagB family
MKKVRKIRHFLVLAGFLLAFQACIDMDETVFSDLIAEQFSPTASDLGSMIGPVYTELQTVYHGWHNYFDLMEECTDHIVTPSRPRGWDDGGVYRRMHLHTWTSLQSHSNNLWNRCYVGINNANRVIFQIESGNLPLDEATAAAALAELRVARAFYYYILVDSHGNVPINTVYEIEPGFLPKQNTRTEVFNFIVNEITASLPQLKDEVSTHTYARFNNVWAAKALLAKLYLNAQVYTGNAKWNECISLCDEIIQSGRYHLESNYRAPFATNNHNSGELIFAVPSDDLYGSQFRIHLKTLPSPTQPVWNFAVPPWGYGGFCAIPQFINTYDPEDSRLKDSWIMGFMISAAGDTIRSQEDGVSPLQFKNELRGVILAGEMEGYRLGKYEFARGTRHLSNDFPVFRYADILMMKAESLLRTGRADEAASLVTMVRERAFKDNPGKAVVTGSQLLQGSSYQYGHVVDGVMVTVEGGGDIPYGRFLDELGWEFTQEARRRQDMIRFGMFTTKSFLSHVPNGHHRTIFPIPQAELDKNPNLSQNPGY